MCTVCGLPTTHSSLTQTLGLVTLFSFALTTFIGAWWVVTTLKVRQTLQQSGWLSFLRRTPPQVRSDGEVVADASDSVKSD